MHRQIVLDTETTGLRVEDGHRIIEIGCIEMIGRKLTGQNFHQYINPERDIEKGAQAVHGLTNEFLQSKPIFSQVAKEFVDYISGSELIIHNAVFDLSFINNEILLSGYKWKLTDDCNVIDTLQIARQLHVGQRNSLDALCKRYGVDTSMRDFHGALLDAHLLAQVYLAMTGGQGSFFDTLSENQNFKTKNSQKNTAATPLKHHNLVVIKANEQELNEHEQYLRSMQERGKCIWIKEE